MKNILLTLSTLLMLLVGLVAGYQYKEPLLKAAGGAFGLSTVQSRGGIEDVISTTTLSYLSPGAGTTTLLLNTQGTDQADINIFVVASSTLLDLRWRVEFSHSTTSVAADQVWFPEPIELNLNATTTNLSQISREYQWRFASTTAHRVATSTWMDNTFDVGSTGSKRFVIKDIAAQLTRVIFYIPTGSQTSSFSTTALGETPAATSTNAGIRVFSSLKNPL